MPPRNIPFIEPKRGGCYNARTTVKKAVVYMHFPRNGGLSHITDVYVAMAICAIAMIAGSAYYYGPGRTLIDVVASDFEPAALWASGHGYSHANPAPPALDNFLRRNAEHLNPHELPASMTVTPAVGQNDLDRVYLLYVTGMIWRILGIDWAWLSLVAGIGAGLMAAAVYAIFRLGMNRPLSVLGTLLAMSSPLMVVMLPCLRDFWKGPFILATLFACGYLLSRPVGVGRFLLTSLFLGVVAGIGYGFRQDCIVCLPVGVFAVVLLAHRKQGRLGLGMRIVGAAVLLLSFVGFASPVLLMLRDTGGTNGLYLLQGHAIYCQATMGMRRACYAPIAQTDDAFVDASSRMYNVRTPDNRIDIIPEASNGASEVINRWFNAAVASVSPPKDLDPACISAYKLCWLGHATADILCGRINGGLLELSATALLWIPNRIYGYSADKGVEYAERRLIVHLVTTFPADVISRCYAATAHIVRGMRGYAATRESINPSVGTRGNPDKREEPTPSWHSVHLFIERHLEHFGEYYALAALIIISMRSSWSALAALGLILYFCGYVGLYFQERHAYHLEFLAFWFPMFCVTRTIGLLRTAVSKEGRRKMLGEHGFFAGMGPPIKRVVVFLAIAVVALSLPLYVARLWQKANAKGILQAYKTCQLESIPFEEKTAPDGTRYFQPPGLRPRSLREWALVLTGLYTDPLGELLHDFYVAEFETPPACSDLTMRVLYKDCMWDCICSLRDDYDEGSGKGPLTVRYFFPIYQFTRYHQDTHPYEGFALPDGAVLKNVYRVINQREFQLPMNLWLFDEPGNSRWYQAFSIFGIWI